MLPAAPRIDLAALAGQAGVDLPAAFAELQQLYADVDARNARHTGNLDLPCHRGCSMCCHESVFLTALEFFYAWDYVQRTLSDAERQGIVAQGLAIYRRLKPLIDGVDGPVPEGARDHFALARQIRFACPMLSDLGACRVYPARELLARIFGCSFNDEGGVYGCHLVAAHLGGKTVTLVQARPVAKAIEALPLTHKRQVYPYWIQLLYGQADGSLPLLAGT